jgi:hypothetical protein
MKANKSSFLYKYFVNEICFHRNKRKADCGSIFSHLGINRELIKVAQRGNHHFFS